LVTPGQRIMPGTGSRLPNWCLFAFERRGAAVGPREDLSAVVGREQYDGVVGDAQIIEAAEELADHTIEFDHAVGLKAQPVLFSTPA